MRLFFLTFGLALASAAIALSGCGSSDSADQATLEQARREGAIAAHRADEIHQLQKKVSSLERERSGPSSSTESAASASTGASAEEVDSRIPASGTYSGQAEQRGTPARLSKDYPLEMTFSSSGSFVSYPTLGCEGSLRPLGFEGNNRLYEETITSGHCDSGGTWDIRVDDAATLAGAWSLPSASYSVTALLQR